jgi:hypothetical protein
MKIDCEDIGMEKSNISKFDFRKNDGLGFQVIPIGTFAGTIEQLLLVRNGEIVPTDTGDQGGGQN